MDCHGNHEILYNQRAFNFEDNIFVHLSGPIEQICTCDEMPYVFNLGLITPLDTSLANGFPSFYKISLIFMNMQMR